MGEPSPQPPRPGAVGDTVKPWPHAVPDPADLDERALVEAARSDADAMAELYRRYLPRIHAFAYRRTGSRTVAEDVTSATFERALRSLDQFRWRGGGFGAWLFRIAANELVDHHRREQRNRAPRVAHALVSAASAGDADASVGIDRLDVPGDAAPLLAALATINPRYQRAISLRYLAGLSHDEAAAAMGTSKAVMAVTLHRAVAALRKAARP